MYATVKISNSVIITRISYFQLLSCAETTCRNIARLVYAQKLRVNQKL